MLPTVAPQETQPGTVHGHGRLHVARAGEREIGGLPLGPVRSGLDPLRDGDRQARVPDGDTGAETLSAIIRDEPESVAQINPRAPAPLRWIVERCLAKDPDERYASTRDLARDLKSVREHIGEVTSSASGATGVVEPSRRRSSAIPLAIGALVLGVLGGIFFARRTSVSSQPRFQRLTFQRGTVSTARFGPDGQTVYYSAAWEGGEPRIFSLRPGNPESSALLLPSAHLLGISSNGEIAIQLAPRPAVSGFANIGTLARAPLSGGAPKEVLQDVTYAEWAPGAPELAVVHRVAGKERLEFPIGKTLFETAGWIQGPRFSPDGSQIAFLHHPTGGDDGTVMVVDRSGKTTDLAGGWSTVQGLAWGPRAGEVWFTAAREGIEREIFAVSLSGKLRLVRTMQGTPALLDLAGANALVTEDDYQSGVFSFLPGQTTTRNLGWFDWSSDRTLSADGKLLLFDESGEGGGAAGSVYLRPTDGSPAVRLGDGLAVALSPDSAWALTRSMSDPSHFILVPVKAGQPLTLPPDEYGRTAYGSFFPDGKRFAFVGAAPGHGSRLYVQGLDGKAATPISSEGLSLSRVMVSPDGRQIAAIGSDERVHLYPSAGGPPVDLASSEARDFPAGWTADGRGLYVGQTGNPCRVDRIDVASGHRTHVRDLAGTDAAGVSAFGPARVTPDGATMTAGFNRVLSTLYKVRDLR